MNEDLEKQLEFKKQIEVLENTAKKYLSKEALGRYGNLKSAHPEVALKAIVGIAQAVQMGNINEMITDEKFKEILMEMKNG